MCKSKYLAADFGAESGRVIIGTLDNNIISLEEIHRFSNHQIMVQGRIYWDLLALFSELKKGLTAAAKTGHQDIRSIGIDTWGVDFGLIDHQGRLIGNPVCYRDSRTDGMMERTFKKISREKIYNLTGIQFMQLNTIFQLVSMVEEKNPQLQIADKLLFMPDLFNYLLTGKIVAEYSIASTSQLLNSETKFWEDEIFNKLNLPKNVMPEVVEPGSLVGQLLDDVAAEVGLNPVNVIAPAGHDTACAVAAVPAESGNWAYLSSGTWSLLGIESKKPIVNKESYKYGFTNEGGVDNTIRFLKNIMGMWLLEHSRRSWKKAGLMTDYDNLLNQASNVIPFQSIVNPDDPSFLNPPDMPEAIAGFCNKTGQNIPKTEGEFVRCILESLAFKYRFVIEMINSMRPIKVERLHIVGGGSQNKMLNQFIANATGIPISAGPIEGTAIGNIMMQAIADGKIKNINEGRKLVGSSFPVEHFEPQETESWDHHYQKIITLFE
jgi:rhamnulokinase